MIIFLRKLKKNKLVQRMSSIRITVTCLSLLFVLVFWGTIAQVEQGLFLAQQRYFYSWFFLAAGFIPFPAAKLVLFILFINLVCVAFTRFVYSKSHLGILIIHLGLLTYFISAYTTYKVVQESNLTFLEEETTNVSKAYHNWELSVWDNNLEDPNVKNVYAFDSDHFKPNQLLNFSDLGFDVEVQDYFPSAQAYTTTEDTKEKFLNASGIKQITRAKIQKEPEKNIPATKMIIKDKNNTTINQIILFGEEPKATTVKMGNKSYSFALRRKHFVLPFKITLKHFEKQFHPGTETARSYSSRVLIEHDGFRRESLISMNTPLRYKDWTFYQASYSVDAMGREYSTLAVVKNWGRLLPYISSLLTFTGLATHFLLMAFSRRMK